MGSDASPGGTYDGVGEVLSNDTVSLRSGSARQPIAAKRIAKVGEDNICTSIIVAAELRYGCAKSGSRRLLKAVDDLLGEIDVLPLEGPADDEYGKIRAELEASGTPIGGNDLLIAAHARSIDATIVTDNTGEFKRIRGLKVENWLL